jgi:hypothetical protein
MREHGGGRRLEAACVPAAGRRQEPSFLFFRSATFPMMTNRLITLVLLSFALLGSALAQPAPPEVAAKSYLVQDLTSNQTLASGNCYRWVLNAADNVGNAAQKVGNAAQDAADNVTKN